MSPTPPSPRPTLLQRLYPGVRLSPCTAVRIAGFVPVILILAVIVLAYITAIPATLFPLRSLHPTLVYPLLIIFHFIYLNVLANYLLLILIDPGTPPPDWKAAPPPPPNRVRRTAAPQVRHPARVSSTPLPNTPSEPDDDDNDTSETGLLLRPQQHHSPPAKQLTSSFRHAHLMQERSYNGALRYCRFCSAYKPDRAHHCSVCRRCILRMDHHCVFVNNCVSFYNHKFFVSFVSYAFIGCLFIAVVSFPTFAAVLSTSPSHIKSPRNGTSLLSHVRIKCENTIIVVAQRLRLSDYANLRDMSATLKTLAMVGYIVTAAFAFALAIFVGLHMYLVAKGRTTIEMYELTDPNRVERVLEYDLGVAKNFKKVFGAVPLCWFLPTRAFVEGDGITYERRVLPERADFSV